MASAIEVTGVLQREAWARRVLPPVERVRPGLWSVPVPVLAGTVRYTNVYVFESKDGVTLVDAGYDGPAAWEALVAGLEQAGHALSDVRRVLVTHAHRDHYGQAARIRRESGALIAMHAREAATLSSRFQSLDAMRDAYVAWMHRCGVPAEEILDMLPNLFTSPVEMPDPDILIEDGALLAVPSWRLRALWTPGHTPGHLSFVEEGYGLLLSGDTLLPRITPNVSSNPRQSENPLGEFLQTLDRLDELTAGEVLPAHEFRFRGLVARVAQIRGHHEDRLDQFAQHLADGAPRSAWEIAALVTWSRPWSETPPSLRRLALGETVAHLVVLAERGRAVADVVDGVEVWTPGPGARRQIKASMLA